MSRATEHRWKKRTPEFKYSYWDCARCGAFILDLRGRKHATPLFDKCGHPCKPKGKGRK